MSISPAYPPRPAEPARRSRPTAARDDDVADLRRYLDRRMNTLRQERLSWWSHWQDLSDYILPRRGRFLISANQANRGDPRNQKIIDSTGTLAARTLASGMMAGLTSPARPWFRLSVKNPAVADQALVKEWLDEVAKRIMATLAKSNFYNALAVAYEELGVFGTAVMLILEDPEDVIRCHALTAGEYFLANSERLAVNTLYREFTLTVGQVAAQFGLDACSATVRSLYATGYVDREVMIGHAIEPNEAPVEPGLPWTKMPWRSVYWELGTGQTQVLDVRGFWDFPVCAPRWHLVGNDVYGRSPGMDALGDIRALQIEQKRKAQAIEKMVNPPMLADAALKNQPASLLPGGVTYLPGSSTGIGMRPIYEVNPPLDGLIQDIQEVQGRINQAFYADLWLMISQLDDVRSAAEIAARKEEKLLMLGPVLERLHGELLSPALARVFGIMSRNKLLPPPPPGLGPNDLSVEYVSMLAQAQKSVSLGGIERLLTFVGQVAPSAPQTLDKIDVDEAVDEYADLLGVSPRLLRQQSEVEQIRQSRQAAQQTQQQMQTTAEMLKDAERASKVRVAPDTNAVEMMIDGIKRRWTGFAPTGALPGKGIPS